MERTSALTSPEHEAVSEASATPECDPLVWETYKEHPATTHRPFADEYSLEAVAAMAEDAPSANSAAIAAAANASRFAGLIIENLLLRD